MPLPRTFQTFAEFEREILRPESRIGLSLEDIAEQSGRSTAAVAGVLRRGLARLRELLGEDPP